MTVHGTEGGYSRHRRNGEKPCSACKANHAACNRSLREEKDFIAKRRPVKPATPTSRYPDYAGAEKPLPCQERDAELWFERRSEAKGQSTAKSYCATCPLIEACLNYALAWDLYGVWGATTRTERRKIQKRDGITAQPTTHYGNVA
jgi:WhiB family redox-sensing transcriptional regulator